MNSKRGYVIISGLIIALSCMFYFAFFQSAPKVVYDFPCGVPKVLVNPMSKDTTMSQFVIDKEKIWDKNKLMVYFMNDDTSQETIDEMIMIANEWSRHANIKFKSTEEINESDIRVTFSENKGYVSAIGNDAENYENQSTMSLGNLNYDIKQAKIRSIVLHEFGHSLGLLHEMHNPENPIIWDTSEAYTYFKDKHDWEKNDVDEQVFAKIKGVKHSKFDSLSIMTYPIPKELTLNKISIPMVSELSKNDIDNISIYYTN